MAQSAHFSISANCFQSYPKKTTIYSYCKRGYFCWGEIWQDISRGCNFHEITPIINEYGFYFRVGVIFAKKIKKQKTQTLPPRKYFHVYSIRIRKASYKNKTNHPISSNSHPSATANIVIHFLKREGGYKANGNIIQFRQSKKQCTRRTFRKKSSSGMLIILTKN